MAEGNGVVAIMLDLPIGEAEALAVPGGVPADELHLTMLVMGPPEDYSDGEKDLIAAVVSMIMKGFDPFHVGLSHVVAFPAKEETRPVVALAHAPELVPLRSDLVKVLGLEFPAGVAWSEHGFAPHVTLTSIGKGEELPKMTLPVENFLAETITVAFGRADRRVFPIGQELDHNEPER